MRWRLWWLLEKVVFVGEGGLAHLDMERARETTQAPSMTDVSVLQSTGESVSAISMWNAKKI